MDAYDEVLSIEKKYQSTLNSLNKKSLKDFNAKKEAILIREEKVKQEVLEKNTQELITFKKSLEKQVHDLEILTQQQIKNLKSLDTSKFVDKIVEEIKNV